MAREGPSQGLDLTTQEAVLWDRGMGFVSYSHSPQGCAPGSPGLGCPVHLLSGLPLPIASETSFSKGSGSPDSCVWGESSLSLSIRV